MIDYTGKHALVLGLGASGIAAANYLRRRGANVLGMDRFPEKCSFTPVVHEGESVDLSSYDFVVLSPGVNPSHPILLQAQSVGIPIIGEIELACREITQRAVGITGTNGKTTVTLMTAHVLETCGIPAKVVGNIESFLGQPLASALDDSFSGVYVIELSSYQLETLQTKVLDAAVILNITPDHLDRYGTMESYATAKAAIVNGLKENAPLWIENECLKQWKHLFQNRIGYTNAFNSAIYAEKIEYFLPEEYRNRRDHHTANIMAVYALLRTFGIADQDFTRAIASFRKPLHRIEFVRELGNISFYNDSKGTNLDAVIQAVRSMRGPVALIAGGVDKGAPYTPWIEAFNGQVEHIYAIGQAAAKIQSEMNGAIPVTRCSTLEEAVCAASSFARPGMHVLLSPGCASYDMFKDYAHRGDEFKKIVNSLPQMSER